jgi:hypothetical protein
VRGAAEEEEDRQKNGGGGAEVLVHGSGAGKDYGNGG